MISVNYYKKFNQVIEYFRKNYDIGAIHKLTDMRLLFFALLCLMMHSAFAQETSGYTKFGKITSEELQKKIYSIDSNANAVVLSDIGEAAIEGNSKGWFSISFSRHRVVHILNKNGYDEANVEVHLYTDGEDEEKLENVKAVTYNLENGKIIKIGEVSRL